MGKVFSHPTASVGYAVGHVDSQGIIYNHQNLEAGYAVGHINSNGRIYRHPNLEVGYDIGHISGSTIYSDSVHSVGYAVGHIDNRGVIYRHSVQEAGYSVGRIESLSIYDAGAAAYFLLTGALGPLNGGSDQKTPAGESPVTKQNSPTAGNSPAGQNTNPPRGKDYSDNGMSGIIAFLVIIGILILSQFIEGIGEMFSSFPGMITGGAVCLFGAVYIMTSKTSRGVLPDKLKEENKKASPLLLIKSLKWSIIPMLGVIIISVALSAEEMDVLDVLMGCFLAFCGTAFFITTRWRKLLYTGTEEQKNVFLYGGAQNSGTGNQTGNPNAGTQPGKRIRPGKGTTNASPQKRIFSCPYCNAKLQGVVKSSNQSFICGVCGKKFIPRF